MRNFIFHNPVKIYFGEGQAVHVAEEAKSRPGAVLLVYGGGSIKRNGAYDDVTAALREAGNEVVELSGVTPNLYQTSDRWYEDIEGQEYYFF